MGQRALFSIAEMYYHGENVGGRNLEVALKWYKSAAESGSETKININFTCEQHRPKKKTA